MDPALVGGLAVRRQGRIYGRASGQQPVGARRAAVVGARAQFRIEVGPGARAVGAGDVVSVARNASGYNRTALDARGPVVDDRVAEGDIGEAAPHGSTPWGAAGDTAASSASCTSRGVEMQCGVLQGCVPEEHVKRTGVTRATAVAATSAARAAVACDVGVHRHVDDG